jgi:hypothetical protein
VALLDEIEQWAEDSVGPRIFWLHGLVGTGKSTIAHTVAERCFAKGRLGASFFCSGDRSLKNHDDHNSIFPTLAFQLAQKYSKFRSALVHHLQPNLEIVYESLESQAKKLIVESLQSAGVATVIVIDALDECRGEKSSSTILSVLESIVEQVPKVKFFITSRPGPLIECGFSRPKHVVNISALHDTARGLTDSDIRVFLQHKLSGLTAWNGPGNRPTDAQLDLLCGRAAGLFAYATATIKFLDHWRSRKRYGVIELSPDDTIHEGKVEGVHGGLSLDSLCTSIFQASFKNNTVEEDDIVRSVLATALLTPRFSPSTIPETDVEEVMGILTSISSLVELHKNNDSPVRPFHKLLSDCLTNRARCHERFLIHRNHVDAVL